MSYQQEKIVRFKDWRSQKRFDLQSSSEGGVELGRLRSAAYSVSDKFQRGFEYGSERIKRLTGSVRSFSLGKLKADDEGSRNKILDPQGSFLHKWNKIFVLLCVVAVSLDPLFFYIPIINGDRRCLELDWKLELIVGVLRTFTDIFYLIHIIFQFRTGFIAPSSRVFGRGVLVENSWEIAKRYLSSYFIIDILAVLPLPQMAIVIIAPKLKGARSLNTKNLLKIVVILQYIPRVLRIRPLYKEVTRSSGILTETAWAGAALNLFLYMLASHVIGACWYLLSIQRETTCWLRACGDDSDCRKASFDCQADHTGWGQTLSQSCPIQTPNATLFDFGIFLNALQSGVLESQDFPQKFFYCFWWGLQNLRTLKQVPILGKFASQFS